MDIYYSIVSFVMFGIGPALLLIATGFSITRLIKNRKQPYPKRSDDISLVVITSVLLSLAIIVIAILTRAFTQNISFM